MILFNGQSPASGPSELRKTMAVRKPSAVFNGISFRTAPELAMTDSVGNYALLFEALKEKDATDSFAYVEYLLSRISIVIYDSSDEHAKNFICKCAYLLKDGRKSLSKDDVHDLQYFLEIYSDEDHLRPPHKEYYLSLLMLMAFSVVKYVKSNDGEIFIHICEQYETLLQVLDFLIDGSGVYAGDLKEVSDRFLQKSERNTYFEQFSRLVNKHS